MNETRRARGDREAPWAECGLCGGEIGWGERYYRVAGENVCREVPGGLRRTDPGGVRGERGRGRIGRRSGIPWEDIRERYEEGGVTLRELAERYGVTERSVYLHARNEAWEGPRRWSLRRGGEAQTELAGRPAAVLGGHRRR